jgi:regulator of protease activity HflC (stomatin/prohibitin superfamily)
MESLISILASPILWLVIVGWYFVAKTIRVVPQQSAWVVERLGRYHATLTPGLNIIIPFIDTVVNKHSLKENPLDVPKQICITRDNTQIGVDGILYFQVKDPQKASYGSEDYVQAIVQLAQTTLRSAIGKMELDKTFEERDQINRTVVAALDEASLNWGVKVLRYEIKDIQPPDSILRSMEKQITAEREKRAAIAFSEGQQQSQINVATGDRESAVRRSEGERQANINRAQGEAESIRLVADATAGAIAVIAAAINKSGGMEAINLRVAERYVEAFEELAKTTNTLIVPGNMADMATMVSSAMKIVEAGKPVARPAKAPVPT